MAASDHDLVEDLHRERRLAHHVFAGSLMSNAKWRAALDALAASGLDIRQVRLKFADRDEPVSMGRPWTAAADGFLDSVEFGPFPIIGIEWLEIPGVAVIPGAPARRHLHDLDAVRAALAATGKQLPIEEAPDALRLVGHVR
ncbi:hypothetical protein G5B46_19730 [Caulobacter sp. 602-2]|uniref:Uncharacterized protein n=1 Tax=Caulobacter sp. 602-2 TaxID=2710887 RepID=A0A6G4R1P8_9CAUL|nr:hypothetical protein [Caulobacter sp. 602-2]NGM51846.1 hypothetical protein [Caulobacter sp. 602-2]